MFHMTRRLLLAEGTAFLVAALVHSGSFIGGYEHREARIAESVIAIVLLAGAALTVVRPQWARAAGLTAQGFALLGTLVGILTIIIGVGPRTIADVVYHVSIAILLVAGLVAVGRARSSEARA